MTAVAKWLHLVALAIWLGSIVFFSFAVAPLVFSVLPRADAGRVVSAIFPRYYDAGYICGAIVLVTALVLRKAATVPARVWTWSASIAALMLAVTLYAGMVVQPRAHALRTELQTATEGSPIKTEFDLLHRRAVQLNGSVLLGTLVLSALAASRLRP